MPTADEQVVVDGQRALAVSEVSGDFIYDGGATDPYCIVDNNGTAQRALKVANVGEGGGGGGGTVDQTYDPTSTNAQSGTAVAEAVQPYLKNLATGTSSVKVGGTTTNSQNQVVLVGYAAKAYGASGVAIGSNAGCWAGSIAIGNAQSIGNNSIAISGASIAYSMAASSIQLGGGQNSTANSFQVFDYQMLDGTTGLIPAARIGTGYDATKTQVLKNVNGILTWVDE